MFPVSAAFLARVRQSHVVATRLDVCKPGGSVISSLYASDGGVTVDSTRAVRRDCSFTLPDYTGTLVPSSAASLLSNLSGNELRPYRGVTYDDGTTELVPLGVFPIRGVEATNDASGPAVTVSGVDRASTISRNHWTSPINFAAGSAIETVITSILTSRMPTVTTNFPTTGATIQATTFGLDSTNDPWADAQSLATAAGYDLYFDQLGVARLSQPTDPTTAAAAITYADDASAVIIQGTKSWDGEKGYNGCVVIGESSTAPPVMATVWDTDPASPTYYLGPYGSYPEFITTTSSTVAQAQSAATAQLARRRGVAQSVTWEQLVNPALDVNDAVAFTSADLKVSALTVVIDSLSIPWKADGTMSAATRTRQVV